MQAVQGVVQAAEQGAELPAVAQVEPASAPVGALDPGVEGEQVSAVVLEGLALQVGERRGDRESGRAQPTRGEVLGPDELRGLVEVVLEEELPAVGFDGVGPVEQAFGERPHRVYFSDRVALKQRGHSRGARHGAESTRPRTLPTLLARPSAGPSRDFPRTCRGAWTSAGQMPDHRAVAARRAGLRPAGSRRARGRGAAPSAPRPSRPDAGGSPGWRRGCAESRTASR